MFNFLTENIVPTFSGAIFFCIYVYMTKYESDGAFHRKLLGRFSLLFCLFVITRPIQVQLDHRLLVMGLATVRLYLFLSFCLPLIHAALFCSQKNDPPQYRKGQWFGGAYVIFHSGLAYLVVSFS